MNQKTKHFGLIELVFLMIMSGYGLFLYVFGIRIFAFYGKMLLTTSIIIEAIFSVFMLGLGAAVSFVGFMFLCCVFNGIRKEFNGRSSRSKDIAAH